MIMGRIFSLYVIIGCAMLYRVLDARDIDDKHLLYITLLINWKTFA